MVTAFLMPHIFRSLSGGNSVVILYRTHSARAQMDTAIEQFKSILATAIQTETVHLRAEINE